MRQPAVEILNSGGSSPLILLCEHASNHIPERYERLGLSSSDLDRHIAYDLGAAELTRSLAGLLDAPAFLATHSRLLIDLNRPLHVEASIPLRSEATEIVGNLALGREERALRAERMFHPFHDAVSMLLDRRKAGGIPTRIACIHSFTPTFLGVDRPWHAGILFDRAERWGRSIIRSLASDPELIVEANVPYSVTPEDDYALPVHGDARNLDAVLIEIRNDTIREATGIAAWTDRLACALMTD